MKLVYELGLIYKGENMDHADLSELSLRKAYLVGADLRVSDLSGADLSDSDLTEADLRGADLRRTDLREAILAGAQLCGANLGGANLRVADLSGADLRETIGLTQEELEKSIGNQQTCLPDDLQRPRAWQKPIDEQEKELEI